MSLGILDIIIVMIWLTLTLGAGIVAGLRTTVSGYWASERSAKLLPLVLSVIATQVGAGAVIGIASATWEAGLGFGLVSLFSSFAGFLLVARYAPILKRFGDKYKAITLPDFFRVRYGRIPQLAGAAVILFTYFSVLAAQFLATSTLISMGTGIDLTVAIVFATVGVILYTAFAGILGDIVTDIWHFAGMVVVLFLILLPAIGQEYTLTGWMDRVPAEIWSPVTFGGYAFVIAGLLFGAVVPMLMPELWMKVYASRTAQDGRKVMVWAAFGIIPFYLLAMYLGLLGNVEFSNLGSGDELVFSEIGALFPAGLLGLGIASILSVTISSANSLIVVIGATIFKDLMGRDVDSEGSLRTSRITVGICGLIGAILALAIPDIVQLLLNAFYMLLVLGPALVGVFVWKRATSKAATWSIILGALGTLSFLFIAPTEAFLPGLVLSILAFLIVTFLTRHSKTENQDLVTSLRSEEG